MAVIISMLIGQGVDSATSLAYTDKSDCSEIRALLPGYPFISGVYNIQVGYAKTPVQVYCQLNDGDWTYIQRRIDGSTDFKKSWAAYVDGFGDAAREYWIGLENLHAITSSKRYILRIEMTDCDNVVWYAEYDNFVVGGTGGCDKKYNLVSIGKYCGNAGDSLTPHIGAPWTTYDQDNDAYASNCAVVYHGAWWYVACHSSNLNGDYKVPCVHSTYADGINWKEGKGYNYSYKRVVMKIRPYTV